MSLLVSGQPLTKWGKLADNTETTIFTASNKTTIVQIGFTENEGGTPTLAIWREASGVATDYELRSVLAVTARQRVLIDEVLTLNTGDVLKAQSNDATGAFAWTVTYLAPNAPSR
jgi:hypothetical protein